jgi:hypothetical protein
MEARRSTSARLILRPRAAGVACRHSGHATEPSRWTARSEWPHSRMCGAVGAAARVGVKGAGHTGHSHVDAAGAAVSIGAPQTSSLAASAVEASRLGSKGSTSSAMRRKTARGGRAENGDATMFVCSQGRTVGLLLVVRCDLASPVPSLFVQVQLKRK